MSIPPPLPESFNKKNISSNNNNNFPALNYDEIIKRDSQRRAPFTVGNPALPWSPVGTHVYDSPVFMSE